MPRRARKHAISGIYHVMLRGINCQQILEDIEDNLKFMQILKECKLKCGYKILAYCLMGNHIHILIKEESMPLGEVIKRISIRFVYWYNTKYQRVGHLFQDRFKSEAVDDETYLFTVIRYIHQNPVKAGMCKNPGDYPYSSFREYLWQQNLVDIDYVEQFISRKTVVKTSNEYVAEECMEIQKTRTWHATDKQAKKIIMDMTGCDNVTSFQRLPVDIQNECIGKLKKSGASIRQISRLTGITYYAIQKVNHRTVP